LLFWVPFLVDCSVVIYNNYNALSLSPSSLAVSALPGLLLSQLTHPLPHPSSCFLNKRV
jgi:hypothetical protein